MHLRLSALSVVALATCLATVSHIQAAPIDSDEPAASADAELADRGARSPSGPAPTARPGRETTAKGNAVDLLIQMGETRSSAETGAEGDADLPRARARPLRVAQAASAAAVPERSAIVQLARSLFAERERKDEAERPIDGTDQDLSVRAPLSANERASLESRGSAQSSAGSASRSILSLPVIRFIRENRELVLGAAMAALAALGAAAVFKGRQRR